MDRLWLAVIAMMPLGARAQGPAPARTPTCIEIVGEGDRVALERLIRSEIDRHTTHQAADSDCASFLRVELIELDAAMGGGRFVTGRMNAQVPHREPVPVEGGEPRIDTAVASLLTVLLHNDPVRLRGPRREGWLRSNLRMLGREGTTLVGMEAFQTTLWLDSKIRSLPGVALTARREVDRWHVGFRVSGAFAPATDPNALALEAVFGVHLEAAWFADPLGDTSFFVAGVAGIEHQRFHGPAPLLGDGVMRDVGVTGLAGGVRAGMELMRITDTRLTVFAQGLVPMFPSSDDVSGVVDAWLPSVSAGVGMVF